MSEDDLHHVGEMIAALTVEHQALAELIDEIVADGYGDELLLDRLRHRCMQLQALIGALQRRLAPGPSS